jgi:hypothetical protein
MGVLPPGVPTRNDAIAWRWQHAQCTGAEAEVLWVAGWPCAFTTRMIDVPGNSDRSPKVPDAEP